MTEAMKFHFENVGPLDKVDLELGDLTIIAGRNNTGKTSLVKALYAFLKDAPAPFHAVAIKHAGRNLMDEGPSVTQEPGPMHEAKLDGDVEQIVGGSYTIEDQAIRFVSRSRHDRRVAIPLPQASSSACSLSDLYFFLRHHAVTNQLLIIDGPELHLDTSNQILLARLLVHCVHAGMKVLITTHSDYLLKEINILVMLSSEFEGKERLMAEHGYDKRDFLRQESLRGYVAEDGQLTRCLVDKFGVYMPFFDETINAINKASVEIECQLDDTEEE